VETARTLNPDIQILVRSHNEEEAALLAKEGVGRVFLGEVALADGMSDHVVEAMSRA
jgi:CPA2 family monovalent cation:H+ antiporter-2